MCRGETNAAHAEDELIHPYDLAGDGHGEFKATVWSWWF